MIYSEHKKFNDIDLKKKIFIRRRREKNGCPNDGLQFQKHIKYIKNKQKMVRKNEH
jgi:hypothetical protein